MKNYLALFLGVMLIAAYPAHAADAPALPPPSPSTPAYVYAHNDAEYSVNLPEAPTVETIWADAEKPPYLDNPPKEGSLGEVATFKRTDPDTGETYIAKITFLKTDKEFLDSLTEDKIKSLIEKDIKDEKWTDPKFSFSAGNGQLKWATQTGFTFDKDNHSFFNAEHFLTGLQTILVVQVQFSVENKTFQDYYKTLTDSITYHAL